MVRHRVVKMTWDMDPDEAVGGGMLQDLDEDAVEEDSTTPQITSTVDTFPPAVCG